MLIALLYNAGIIIPDHGAIADIALQASFTTVQAVFYSTVVSKAHSTPYPFLCSLLPIKFWLQHTCFGLHELHGAKFLFHHLTLS